MKNTHWAVLLLLSLAFATSCSYRTIYKMQRVPALGSHNVPIDPRVFTLIDTSSVYQYVEKFSERNPEPPYRYAHRFLKFYAKGRVGRFFMYNIEEVIADPTKLDPRRADMGYYKYSEKGLEISINFEHVQGGGFISERLVHSSANLLIFSSGRDSSTYIKKTVSPRSLVYTPDW